MSESITTALITGGFMLMVIVINEVLHLLRERRARKKEFFNQFFPERIKAHEEIMRIMTKGGLDYVNPKLGTVTTVKKSVERLIGLANEAVAISPLFADRYIEGDLLDLIEKGSGILKYGGANEKVEPESELAEAVAGFNLAYYHVLKMLRKKSGADLIEEVFESIPQKGDSQPEEEGKDNG